MARSCATWATAAGGTSSCRPGATGEAARSPRLPWPRGCAGADDQGGAGGGPPRPRPGPLRAAAPQRPGLVPAVPPAARPARAPAADPAHPAPATGAGRPVLRPLLALVRSRRPPPQLGHDPNQTHGQPARIGHRTADPGASLRRRRPSCGPRRDVTGAAAALAAGGSGATGAAGLRPRPICLASAERVAA